MAHKRPKRMKGSALTFVNGLLASFPAVTIGTRLSFLSDKTAASPNAPKTCAPAKAFVPASSVAPAAALSHCKAPSEPPLVSPPVEAMKNGPKPTTAPTTAPTNAPAPELTAESEEEKAKKLLYCSLCKVAVNSLSQLEAHNTGELGSVTP